jgi:RNA polymerase sigma factor (TIGR02999 family)
VTKSGQPSLEGDQPGDVTGLLLACRDGGRAALERILPILYEELRRIARAQLRREAEGHTLVTTALVHEAYLRLVDVERVEWRDRVHFLSMASRAMRRVLIDHARRHHAARRGGGVRVLTLEETVVAADTQAESLLALDEALDALAALDGRLARVVECRFFGGMTEEETAAALGRLVCIERGAILASLEPDAIVPITSDQYPMAARRPANSRLDTTKLQETFGLHLPDWQVGLHHTLHQIL